MLRLAELITEFRGIQIRVVFWKTTLSRLMFLFDDKSENFVNQIVVLLMYMLTLPLETIVPLDL